MPSTQASTKYIVNIVLFLTPRSLLFYCTYRNIFGHRFAEKAPETLI